MSHTVLITGAASGIGAQAAKHFAQKGVDLALSDINEEAGLALVDECNHISQGQSKVTFYIADVSDKVAVTELFRAAKNDFGQINVLVNNAGIEYPPTPLHLTDDALFEKNIAVNVKGVWYCMKEALNVMLPNGGGNIINIASVAGLRSAPMIAGYSATKHAVVGLTKSAAVEYAKLGIRINAVCPSFIDTPMVQRTLEQMDERGQKSIVGASPMKRLGRPEEIAAAIVWLASDEASFMNGHCMTLDGGMLA